MGVIVAFLAIAVNCHEEEVSSSASRVCGLPPVKGPCKALITRYFYNATSGVCQKFVYGGCRGNGNNFKSLLQCEQSCNQQAVCNLSPQTGPCDAYFPSFFHNSTSGKCERFVYGGCGGNSNRFGSEKQCLKTCVCSQPRERGPCKGRFRAFYFNANNKRCEAFVYGGCNGNSNRFSNISKCRKTCGGR
ncbi:hypothetical protein EMCRGX_G022779 [Ephydatia muelleri]|eukprot:Em0017g827a